MIQAAHEKHENQANPVNKGSANFEPGIRAHQQQHESGYPQQCAEAMGLSVSSRCRLVIPQGVGESDEGGDEFSAALRARQARAVNG